MEELAKQLFHTSGPKIKGSDLYDVTENFLTPKPTLNKGDK